MYVAVTDCWRGLKRAVELGLYVPSSFDVREYFYYDTNGDLHEVVKGKLFAFRGPVDAAWRSRSGRGGLAPGTLHAGDYIEVFRSLKVTTIIRLNSRQYHREVYTKAGFRHHDIIFPDCTLPPNSLVDAFLRIAEAHKDGAIAIHCMAGLGRTGTMVGLYLMKHLGFSADEAMGWLRIARPGRDGKPASIRGPTLTGPMAFTAWHGYYFSKQYQSLNVVLNVVQSLKSRLFRRDISRF